MLSTERCRVRGEHAGPAGPRCPRLGVVRTGSVRGHAGPVALREVNAPNAPFNDLPQTLLGRDLAA